MDEKRVLGIEGGGTKTDWILVSHSPDHTSLISQGQLGPANLRLTHDDDLIRMFGQLPDATHVGVFLAGCITEQDRNRLETVCRQVWPDAILRVGSDRDSSFAAAFQNADGIVVISGTGAAVTGRRAGRIEKAGGRGHLLGDRGGAYVICIEGLRLALRIYDLKHQTTPLAQHILAALALNSMDDLVAWTQSATKTAIAALAPVMFVSAEQGDEKMRAIIQRGARTLAQYTSSVARRLKLKAPRVRLLGGVFFHQPFYVSLYRNALLHLVPDADVDLSPSPGVYGSAWLAAQDEGVVSSVVKPVEKPIADLGAALTEQSNPRSEFLDRLSAEELIHLFVMEEKYVQQALEESADSLEKAVVLISDALTQKGRLFYIGAGTSGRLGVLDASEIPPTFGESPDKIQGIIAGGNRALYQSVEGAEDDEFQGMMAIVNRGVTSGDVVCGITASGRTPFVLAGLQKAQEIRAKTILLTCNPDRVHKIRCDVEIDLRTGPELLTGSTRLKAGTATKSALNILSTCAMIRLGKVRGNKMLDVRATNAKLRDRAVRLLCSLRKLSYEEAWKILEQHSWNVRKALE